MIDRHFTPLTKMKLDTDADLEKVLNDSSRMKDLLEYLKLNNELDAEYLEPVRTHFGLASEIKLAEE